MDQFRLGEMEEKFADLIWEHAPIRSGELAKLCENAFSWKRTTTYTMLKRLCDRGLFVNENGMVTACMSREDFQGVKGEQFIRENFQDSLPLFVAAFARKRRLREEEIRMLKKLIDEYEED